MILIDAIEEYKFVYDTIYPCKDYFDVADTLTDQYLSKISQATSEYFKINNTQESYKNSLINKLSQATSCAYEQITILITRSFEFYGALKILESRSYLNTELKNLIIHFIENSHKSIDATNTIIKAQLQGMKTEELLSKLITPLQDTVKDYYTLINLYKQFDNVNEMLLEPIPDSISSEDLDILEIRSCKPNIKFSEIAEDISFLSSFLEQFDIIRSKQNSHTSIFVRKIETGSLRIVCGGNTFELSCISDIVKSISDAIRSFRLTGAEKRIMEATAKSLELDNEKKALSIINSQITTITKQMGLDPNSPEDRETIQRLCLPLVRYINNNPVGKIGDSEYNLTTDLKLLEDFYFTKNSN